MSHLHRFFVEPGTVAGPEVALPPEEMHHAAHVARLRVGEAVALFDGAGHEWLGAIARVGKREVVVAVGEARFSPKPVPEITLAQAWLLRDKAVDFIITHGTELGVSRICFYRGARSDRDPRGQEKWRRCAIEACKQCGRPWLPEFSVADSLEEALGQAGGGCYIATKDREPVPLTLENAAGEVTVVVGPEGDFNEEELAAALRLGAKPVSLGAATFRSEVAAVLLLTLVGFQRGRLGARV